ncbi:MAG: acyl-CoA dehydrogenase family protein [Polyangiales bacterium]
MPIATRSHSDLLATVESLRDIATTHAPESERRRTLAPPVVAALHESGLTGFASPAAVGGGEHGPFTQLAVIEALARIDTATAWSLMITALLAAQAGAYLPDRGVQEVFAAGVPLCAGLLFPSGALRRVDGGFRVHGRWGFGSGIRHAEWLVTSAVADSQTPGAPPMWTIVVPASEATIEDTWHVGGLRGTGSHHYRLEDCFVPHDRVFAFPDAPARRGAASFDLPFVALLAPVHAGFVLGAARAALDAIAALAPQKIKAWPRTPLAAHGGFQMDLGRAEAKLRGARALAVEACERLEDRSRAGLPLADADWATVRLAVTYATDVATEVATFTFHAGGGAALYEGHPLERLFRDIHAAAQHVAATDDAYEFAGRLLLGAAEPSLLLGPRAPRHVAT